MERNSLNRLHVTLWKPKRTLDCDSVVIVCNRCDFWIKFILSYFILSSWEEYSQPHHICQRELVKVLAKQGEHYQQKADQRKYLCPPFWIAGEKWSPRQGWGQIRFMKYKYKYKYKNLLILQIQIQIFCSTLIQIQIQNKHIDSNTNTSTFNKIYLVKLLRSKIG